MTDFFDTIKHIVTLKRTKVTLYMAAVLWLAFATQVMVNRVFKEDLKITEAFVKANTDEMQSSIEVVAEYASDFLSETDKKDMIVQLADAIGLNIDRDISISREGTRIEYSFIKMAKQATSEIKLISLELEEDSAIKIKHYIIIRLSVLDSIQSIDRYKNIIEATLAELGVENRQTTMQYKGSYDGELSLEDKNQIMTSLVEELKGEIALEYDEGDIYTVYAYTGLLNEYIDTMGSKVNIQIAMTYNEISDKTTVTLATPILNQSW